MDKTLEERIEEQDEWTFQECLGLAAEYGEKPRMVVIMVLAAGKNYVDGEGLPSESKGG